MEETPLTFSSTPSFEQPILAYDLKLYITGVDFSDFSLNDGILSADVRVSSHIEVAGDPEKKSIDLSESSRISFEEGSIIRIDGEILSLYREQIKSLIDAKIEYEATKALDKAIALYGETAKTV